jgi:hypothetical protein
VYRQQIALVFALLTATSAAALGASPATGLAAFSEEGPGFTLSGTLQHNASDQSGIAPYTVIDRWGVVRGYVSPKPGLELEPYLGRQITLRGTMRRLPAGDMPLLRAEELGSGARAVAVAHYPAEASTDRPSAIRRTEHQEPIPAPAPQGPLVPVPVDTFTPGEPLPGPPELSAGPGPGCPCGVEGGYPATCGCGGPCGPCQPCGPRMCCGPTGIWVDTEYLAWWMRGMHVPPLVTTGSVSDAHPGALGQPGTSVLFGDDNIDDQFRSGGRIQVGKWFDPCEMVGIEGEYFRLGEAATHYRAWSDGDPTLFRPFFNEDPNHPPGIGVGQRAEKVAFPNTLDGAILVDAATRFQGAAALMRFAMCHADSCWNDPCSCATVHDSYRSNLILGYRYLQLDDRVDVTEQLTTTDGTNTTFVGEDNFSTRNQFNGAEIGVDMEFRRNRWLLDFSPRIALGNTRQTGLVSGFNSTTTSNKTAGNPTTTLDPNGDLLTKSTNGGPHSADHFSAVPEIRLKLGYQATQHAQVTLGYDFLAWSGVARAGDQIDLQTTAPGLATIDSHPAYPNRTSTFWAQGLDLGLEFRW